MRSSFDFLNEERAFEASHVTKPFFTVQKGSKEEVHSWLKHEVAAREAAHEDYFKDCQKFLHAYRGAYHKKMGSRQSDSNEIAPLNKLTSKYVVNHLYEMTENMVSRMTRMKPAVDVLPANDENEDKIGAKAVDLLVRHLYYLNDIDFLLQKMHRQRLIFGEAYAVVDWNPDIGDLHPDYVELRDAGKLDALGKVKNSDAPIRVGDVYFSTKVPWEVLLENKAEFEDVDSVIIKKLRHIEELKAEYPDKVAELGDKLKAKSYNINTSREEVYAHHVMEYTLLHRHTKHVIKGRKIVFTDDMVLSDTPLNVSSGELPLLRLTDVDIPGVLHGVSRYSQVLILQNAHNNLSQSVIKNEFLCSAPKWMVPKGACKIEQLTNGRTVIQFQGAVAPQLVQMNPTSVTTLNLRESMVGEMGTIFGVHPVSRGEPPKGITAAVALQFLNDQETERDSYHITKHNNFVVALTKKAVSCAGDNYDPTDGRVLRVFGKDNKHMITVFDTATLSKDYDIRIQNSTAVPQSKAARMERIIQTMQYAPDLFTPERWAELLEFGATEKMHTLITEAINAAESEEEDILEGRMVDEPQEWEDQIIHLRSHYKKMQARSFKEEISPEIRERFIEHVTVTEMLASEKAAVNPLFASKLAQLDQFPVFWKLATVPPSAEQQEAIVQGQANQGIPVTGSIPATEPLQVPGQIVNKVR